MQPGDSELVARARRGDWAAFGRLVERHRPMLLRLAASLLAGRPGAAAEAEDVAQEACLRAYLDLGRLRAPERFGAWLAGIGLNLARMRLRQRKRDSPGPLPDDPEGGRGRAGAALFAAGEADPAAEAEARELNAAIAAAIAALPGEQQAAVRLYYWEGLTVAEAGRAAGAPPGTVKARLHRARRRLRAALSGFVEAEPPAAAEAEEAEMIAVSVQDVVLARGTEKDVLEAAGPLPAAGAEPVRRPLPPGADLLRIVLLKERQGERLLPIWVGPVEGDVIALLRAGGSRPRPLTHVLMARLMEAGGMALERVTVTRLADEVFFATLSVRAASAPAPVETPRWGVSGAQTQEIDARPSDAIALALQLGASIYVDPAVMDQAAVMPDRLGEKLGGEWTPVDVEAVLPGWRQEE
jgi:RNA polymerase sigma-70 factor (ECF subfamily)